MNNTSQRDAFSLETLCRNRCYEDCSNNSYEVSFLICTYNPNYQHLKYAIRSALLQRDLKYQIVIADDGTECFDWEALISFFHENNCHDFAICSLEKNEGTVKNFINGLKLCRGEYIRGLSPEDYIYGFHTMREWIDYIREKKVSISFSNVICYKFENGNIVPIKSKAHPQIIEKYYKGLWEYNYLIFGDICVGAGMLVRKETITKYSTYIDGRIKYAEDNAYRLMAFQRETMAFFDKATVLYEVGNGISTANSQVWNERLKKDWDVADRIMMEMESPLDMLYIQFTKIVKLREIKKRLIRKIAMLGIPGYFQVHMRRKLKPRYTETSVDYDYIRQMLT